MNQPVSMAPNRLDSRPCSTPGAAQAVGPSRTSRSTSSGRDQARMPGDLRLAAQPAGGEDRAHLVDGGIEVLVDDDVVELAVMRHLLAGGRPGAARSLPRCPGRGCACAAPAPARDGGRMNTLTASGTLLRTWRAPCQSISSSTSLPAASCGSTDCRAVPFQSPCTRAYSKKSPASTIASNSSALTKW